MGTLSINEKLFLFGTLEGASQISASFEPPDERSYRNFFLAFVSEMFGCNGKELSNFLDEIQRTSPAFRVIVESFVIRHNNLIPELRFDTRPLSEDPKS